MIEALKKLEEDARGELSVLPDPKNFQDLKNKYLGRKGLFASLSSQIGQLSAEDRRLAGQEMNRVKSALEEIFSEKEKSLASQGNFSVKKKGRVWWKY